MNRLLAASPMVLFLVAACGGTPTQATTPTPEPQPTAKAEPKPEPVASASASAAASAAVPETPPVKKPGGSGRPQAIYNEVSEPQTVGLDGAVFRTAEGAELRIPGGALGEARNVLFVIDKKGKGTTGALGKIYQIKIQMPDTQFRMGEETASAPITSHGDPFVIKLPLPQGKDTAGLAIETVTPDPKTKKNKSTWQVVAQTKTETADTGSKAVYEMTVLPDGHIHLTSQAATAQ